MKSIILRIFASISFFIIGHYALAANVNWTGGGDGTTWNSAANWGGTLPGVNDDAVIPVMAGNPTIKITTAVSVKSVNCSEPLTISPGSLTLAAPSNVSAALIINGATLTVTGAVATFSATGAVTLSDCNLNAQNGASVSFAAATTLTRVNLSATGGGKLLFPAAATYTLGSPYGYSIQASGAGSKIDLSALTSLAGTNGGYPYGVLAISAGTGGEVDLAGAISGNTSLTADATSILGVAGVTAISGTTINTAKPLTFSSATAMTDTTVAAAGVTLSYPNVTALTRVNLSATGGGKLLFPAVTTYTTASPYNYTIAASGVGSKIDLSHLTSMGGTNGSYPYGVLAISAGTGGEVDLAGAITGNTSLTLSDANSVLNVAGVTSLQDTSVTATAGTVNFTGLTALTRVTMSATGGGKLLFPAAATYTLGSPYGYSIQASGAGSKIDLSALTSLAGTNGGYPYGVLAISAGTGGEVDLAGAISGNTSLTLSDANSVLNVAGVTSLTNTTLTAGNGASWTLPSSWYPVLHGGVVITTTGTGQIINEATLTISGAQLSINTSGFVNQGILDPENGGTIAFGGSFRLDGSGGITGASTGNLTAAGDLLGNTANAQVFSPQATITFQGSGTAVVPQQLEAMSKDLGAVSAGFVNNFVYGRLVLGNNTYVKLVDLSDNSPGSGAEAVYATSIIIPAGCTLDINGLHLYARSVQVSGTVLNGTITQIPDSGPLTFGTPTPGGLSVAGELDGWTFFGRGGHLVTVSANPGSGGSPVPLAPQLQWAKMELLGPSDNVLSSISSTSAGAIIALTNVALLVDGTYKIRINAPAGHTSSTGNYIVTAYDVTPTVRTLNFDQPSVGNIATLYALDQWNFSAVAGQQVQFHVVARSSTGLAFKLTGPGGTVSGFQDITGDFGPINLPSTGAYTLSAYGLSGATGTYSFILKQNIPTPLATGTPYNGTWAGSGQAQLFAIPVTTAQPLTIALTDSAGNHHTELYARFGSPPTRQTSDYAANGAGASHSLLVPTATVGTWYVLVYGESIPSAGGFTLLATSTPLVLTSTSTSQSAANLVTTLNLKGAGFNSGSVVSLVAANGTNYPATSSTAGLPTLLTANFAAGSVPAGTYAIKVTQLDGSSAVLPGSLTIAASGQGVLTTRIEVPSFIGWHVAATLYVNYANTGNAPMPAPLVTLNATQSNGRTGAFMTLNPAIRSSGFWTSATPAGYSHSIQILASGATPGVLQPGESVRVPVYYAGWDVSQFTQNTLFNFSLTNSEATDTTPVDWSSKEASLQPPGISSAAWHIVYANLKTQLGTTSGGFVQFLDRQATYLAQLGEQVTDVSKLWRFAVEQAENFRPVMTLAGMVDDSLPVPGRLSLGFGRAFNQSIPGRFQSGPLGLGWFTPWQRSLAIAADGTITLTTGTGVQYTYQPDSRSAGKYFSQQGDHNTLTAAIGGYYLTAVNGTITAFKADGTLNYLQDTNGNRITAGYTAGKLVTLTASSGQSLTLGYNGAGLISTCTDSVGRVTNYTYDASNQHLMSVQFYTGKTVSYTYNTAAGSPEQNSLASITFPAGTHRYFSYDAQGRLAGTSADGGEEPQTLGYNLGQVGVTNGIGATSNYFYNENGQLAKAVDSIGRTAFYDHDTDYNLIRMTNNAGASVSYGHNGLGETTSVTDFMGNSTGFIYAGPQNQLTTLTDANGNGTSYGYYPAGNLQTVTYANGRGESATYDPLGIALSCVNAAGESVQYGSNTAGQLTSASFSDGTRSDYTYDAEGHLKTATNAAGMVQFTYEPTTRLLSRVDYPNGKWLSFGYDAGGRRAQMKDQDDFTTKYTYDAVGRLETLKDGLDNVIVRYTYDHAGRLFQKTNANGTYTTYGYCSCGELADVNNFAPGGALNSQFHYTYDSVGAMRTQTTLDGTWTYTHDANGQLTHAVFASNNAALVPNQDLIYNYDAMGNRTSTVINGVSTAYVPNNMNQYASVGGTNCNYDLKGNLLSDGINSYSYNALNRLVVTSGPSGATSYTYNALGQRVSSASGGQTTQYLIDPTGLGDVVGTFDGNGNLIAHYNYGRGLVSRVAGASSVYYDFDLLGSTTGLSGSTGSYVNKYRYDPFGNSLASTGPIANPFQFVGQLGVEYQGNGIVFMRARFYAAVQGRFTSTDPLSIGAGDTNLFRYVGNNPVAATDPLGLCDISLGLDLGGVPELVTGAGALLVVANASNPVGWVIGGVGLVWWIGGLFNLPHEIQSIMTENGWIDDWSKLHDPLRNFPQEYK